jgi:hypothetical protein
LFIECDDVSDGLSPKKQTSGITELNRVVLMMRTAKSVAAGFGGGDDDE